MNSATSMTKHAERRAHDRSIPEVAMWLLREFGTMERRKGADSYSFDKKSWRELERFLGPWQLVNMEKLKRVYMVVADNGAAVTVA
jgi:hypothetical protein